MSANETPTAILGPDLPDRTLQGVGLMVAFSLLVPAMDTVAKIATVEATPPQIALLRFALQSALVLPVLALWSGLRLPPPADLVTLALRGLLMAAGSTLFFAALSRMSVADAIAIFFVQPMLLTLLSGLWLKEPVGWRRYAACAVGFSGALLVIQPKFAALGLIAAAPLGAACCFSVYLILTRRLAQRSDALTIQLWTGLFAALALGAALLAGAFAGSETFRFAPLSPYVWSLMLVMGAFGALGHLAITAAFARAPASVLAPFQYLEIVMATALGYLVFGDFPDGLTWLGIAIITGSGLVIFHRERLAARRRISATRQPSASP